MSPCHKLIGILYISDVYYIFYIVYYICTYEIQQLFTNTEPYYIYVYVDPIFYLESGFDINSS